MKKHRINKFFYYAAQCSVCTKFQYGCSQIEININNPGLECLNKSCDGMGFILYQTPSSKEALLANISFSKAEHSRY